MLQVKLREGEDPNRLGMIIKHAIDKNLQDAKKAQIVRNLRAAVVIREVTSGTAITIHFEQGEISMHNDAVDKPSATMEGSWESLGKVLMNKIGPIRSVIMRKTKARGNILKLMKASKVIILKDGA
jgi:putative sterol carrier protein